MTTETLADSSSTTADAGEGVRHHSFSAISTFSEVCGLQYRYRYLDRLPQERVSAALVFGTAINAALLSIDKDLAKGRPPRAATAHQVLRSELEKAYGNKSIPVVSTHGEDLEGLYGKGVKMIDHYVDSLIVDEIPVDMPRRFTIPLLDEKGEALPRPLVGELDRVVRLKDGRYGIVDWKTASARWSPDRIVKDDQATAYLLAGKYILPGEIAFFRYDLLLKTVKPAIERYYVARSDSETRRFIKKVLVVDKAVKSGVFAPNDRSFACPTCPYSGACAKWQD
jgi:hypothetical protein